MERIPVQSSNIAAVGYEPTTEILEIEFLSGTLYEYRNVPQMVYEGLMSAPSHGSYFAKEIKGNYPYEKIG